MSDNSKVSYEGDVSFGDIFYDADRALVKDLTEKVDKEVMEYCDGNSHINFNPNAVAKEPIPISKEEMDMIDEINGKAWDEIRKGCSKKEKRKLDKLFKKMRGIIFGKKKEKE